MAMNEIEIRKKQLEKLDNFVHTLYQETQTFKQYGTELPDLEALYLHIHDLIQDLLSVQTSEEFMEKIAEFHKGIAGVLIIVGAGDPTQIAEELKNAHEGMSGMDVEEFLKNMKVKEKDNYKPKPKQEEDDPESDLSEEELQAKREQEKDELLDTLDLEAKKEQLRKQKTKPEVNPPNQGDDPLEDIWNQYKK